VLAKINAEVINRSLNTLLPCSKTWRSCGVSCTKLTRLTQHISAQMRLYQDRLTFGKKASRAYDRLWRNNEIRAWNNGRKREHVSTSIFLIIQ